MLIYNLCNNIDIIETNKRIEQYKKENREIILKNKQRISREQFELDMILDREKEICEIRKQELIDLDLEQKRKKKNEKEALIDELMFSHGDAKDIVKTFVKHVEEEKREMEAMPPPKLKQFSSGIQYSSTLQQQYLPVPKLDEGPLYKYEEPEFINNGPRVPTLEDIEKRGFIKYMRLETPAEKASGFQTKISCLRALQEAMQSLYSS